MTMTKRPKRVREVMNVGGWTLTRLGRTLGVSRERVRQLIDADAPGDGRYLTRIAGALGVRPETLVDEDGNWRLL